jgi:TolA-binding protein
MGLARVAFKEKKWTDAERFYGEIAEKYGSTSAAPEALYWRAVSHYKGTNDHTVLSAVAQELQEKAPQSVWAKKALPWLGH